MRTENRHDFVIVRICLQSLLKDHCFAVSAYGVKLHSRTALGKGGKILCRLEQGRISPIEKYMAD